MAITYGCQVASCLSAKLPRLIPKVAKHLLAYKCIVDSTVQESHHHHSIYQHLVTPFTLLAYLHTGVCISIQQAETKVHGPHTALQLTDILPPRILLRIKVRSRLRPRSMVHILPSS